MTQYTFQLPDGRDLSYCVYGPGDGEPVLYFHGTPSSRLEPLLLNAYEKDFEALLIKYQLCVIAMDRPGMGLSSFNPHGDFISFARDVQLLCEHLKVEKCKVLCWSGGGPFALAIAHEHKKLVQAVYIITGFSLGFSEKNLFKKMHGNKLYFGAARYIPAIARLVLNIVTRQKHIKPIPRIISRLPESDHSLMTEVKRLQQISTTTLQEACRQGSKGAVYEAALYFKNYGYILKNIEQPVHFWWGNEDNVVVEAHAKAIEQQVQNAFMHYKQNEGHLSIYIHCIEEVLQTISAT